MLNLISRDLRIDLGLDVFVIDWWFTDFWADGLKGNSAVRKNTACSMPVSWKPL